MSSAVLMMSYDSTTWCDPRNICSLIGSNISQSISQWNKICPHAVVSDHRVEDVCKTPRVWTEVTVLRHNQIIPNASQLWGFFSIR